MVCRKGQCALAGKAADGITRCQEDAIRDGFCDIGYVQQKIQVLDDGLFAARRGDCADGSIGDFKYAGKGGQPC